TGQLSPDPLPRPPAGPHERQRAVPRLGSAADRKPARWCGRKVGGRIGDRGAVLGGQRPGPVVGVAVPAAPHPGPGATEYPPGGRLTRMPRIPLLRSAEGLPPRTVEFPLGAELRRGCQRRNALAPRYAHPPPRT